MQFINITPTNLIGEVGNTTEMALTHLMLNNTKYREAMSRVTVPVILDNSYFELSYSLSPKELIEAAEMFKLSPEVTIVCPDGTTEGKDAFIAGGFSVMCIPKTVAQFHQFMEDPTIKLVGVSEEHFERRHAVGARYNLFKDYMPLMCQKKIHLLGGTDSLWELGLLIPFKDYIHSWDTSMPVWQGYLGHNVFCQVAKDPTSVNFDVEVNLLDPQIQNNLMQVAQLVEWYNER